MTIDRSGTGHVPTVCRRRSTTASIIGAVASVVVVVVGRRPVHQYDEMVEGNRVVRQRERERERERESTRPQNPIREAGSKEGDREGSEGQVTG